MKIPGRWRSRSIPTTRDPRRRRSSAAYCSPRPESPPPPGGCRVSVIGLDARFRRRVAMFQFILGAVAGAVAAYFYRDRIKGYMTEKTPTVRDRAADKLEAFGKGAEDVLDRAKSRIESSVRAGQERLRSGGGSRPPAD